MTRSALDSLTATEKTYLRYVSQGLSTKEIVQLTGKNEKTINNHIDNANRKLGTGSRRASARLLAAADSAANDMLLSPQLPEQRQNPEERFPRETFPVFIFERPEQGDEAEPQKAGAAHEVREARVAFEGFARGAEDQDHLKAWLHDLTAMPRVALILVIALLVVLLVLAAPNFVDRLGVIGNRIYQTH